MRSSAATLPAALDSVLVSGGVSFEVVCVDDGSSDASGAILDAAARADRRVRVLHTPPLGIVAALNHGLTAARAPLVARMDADDEMHPERLAAQSALLGASADVALVGCGVEPFRSDGLGAGWRLYAEWVNGIATDEAIRREAFVECPIPHPTWMFRRDPVSALGGYRERDWPEDLDLFYRLLESGARVGKVARVLHRWRDHETRLSRRDPRYSREAFARVKAHFLPRLHPMPAAVVWGAGKTGRRFVRLLEGEKLPTRSLLDIHPARIGGRWRGIPILSPAELPALAPGWRAEGVRVLGAVASRGARSEIRAGLLAAGLAEGTNFLLVA